MFHMNVIGLIDAQFNNRTYGYFFPEVTNVFLRSSDAGDGLNGWTQGLLDAILPEKATHKILSQTSDMVCSNNLVVHARMPFGLGGYYNSDRFLERIYGKFGIKKRGHRGLLGDEHERVIKVGIVQRRGNDRQFVPPPAQLRELILAHDALKFKGVLQDNIEVVLMDEAPNPPHWPTFEEQVRMWASLDIAIVTHGAGCINVVFMQRHACLIEVYPHKYSPVGYLHIALFSGHSYQSVMGEAQEDLDKLFISHPEQYAWCEQWHGIDVIV